jgi:flavorubredoxin
MKVLVVYDTVSEAKVTSKVAEAVVEGLKTKGLTVDSFFVEEAGKVKAQDYDCLIVGAPTMAWRPSKRMKAYLAGLKGGSFSGKKAASFDTQMKSSFSGDATKHMDKTLQSLGFAVQSPSLLAYVVSEEKKYKLKEGELEKAKAWAGDLAGKLK